MYYNKIKIRINNIIFWVLSLICVVEIPFLIPQTNNFTY